MVSEAHNLIRSGTSDTASPALAVGTAVARRVARRQCGARCTWSSSTSRGAAIHATDCSPRRRAPGNGNRGRRTPRNPGGSAGDALRAARPMTPRPQPNSVDSDSVSVVGGGRRERLGLRPREVDPVAARGSVVDAMSAFAVKARQARMDQGRRIQVIYEGLLDAPSKTLNR